MLPLLPSRLIVSSLAAALLAVLSTAPACKKVTGTEGDAAVDAGQAAGMAYAGNDPALNALGEEIKNCAFKEGLAFGGYGPCAPLETLKAKANQSSRGFGTMIHWLADASPPIRSAGAETIFQGKFDSKAFADCDEGTRVKAALDKETMSVIGWQLAFAWGEFAQQCPTQDADMQAFLKKMGSPLPEARRQLMARLGGQYEILSRPGWFETIMDISANEQQDSKVREGTAHVLELMPTPRKAASMAQVRALVKDKNLDLADAAAPVLARQQDDEAFVDVVDAARIDLATGGKHLRILPSIVRYLERPDAKLDKAKAFVVATSYLKETGAPAANRTVALDILQVGNAPGWKKTVEGIAASKAPMDKALSQHAHDLLQLHAK